MVSTNGLSLLFVRKLLCCVLNGIGTQYFLLSVLAGARTLRRIRPRLLHPLMYGAAWAWNASLTAQASFHLGVRFEVWFACPLRPPKPPETQK
eukprot:5519257-Amphidinium_carterae.1